MDSDHSFLWLFAVVPDEPPSQCSHAQQLLPDSSWFFVVELTPLPRALCKPLAHAGRAPPRTGNDIDGHGDHGGPTDSNGPCRGRGGPLAAVAAGSLTPNGREGLPGMPAASGPPVGRRWPAGVGRTTSRR